MDWAEEEAEVMVEADGRIGSTEKGEGEWGGHIKRNLVRRGEKKSGSKKNKQRRWKRKKKKKGRGKWRREEEKTGEEEGGIF